MNEQEIARVEIPAWLAESPRLVDLIHVSVLADARLTGYSYVLSQAHMHVSIPLDLGNMLHVTANTCYWAEARHFQLPSAKNQMKGRKGRPDRPLTP